jgi:hypothetical protein
MPRVAVGLLAVVAASFAAGCFEDGPMSGPAPSIPPPLVNFMTSDLSTGVRVASVRISDGGRTVSAELMAKIAPAIRVSTWPGDVEVASSETVSTFPGGQDPSGAGRFGYAQIDRTLDAALDGNGWYAVSLPRRPADYQVSSDLVLSTFAAGALGIRISPAHPPVVSSVMSCPKEGGTVAVYAGFSEPLTKPSGAVALDYGAPAVPCAVGADEPSVTQFICANAAGAQPFSLRIADTVTAAASGSPLAAGTLRSAEMQSAVLGDGCSYYKPAIAN